MSPIHSRQARADRRRRVPRPCCAPQPAGLAHLADELAGRIAAALPGASVAVLEPGDRRSLRILASARVPGLDAGLTIELAPESPLAAAFALPEATHAVPAKALPVVLRRVLRRGGGNGLCRRLDLPCGQAFLVLVGLAAARGAAARWTRVWHDVVAPWPLSRADCVACADLPARDRHEAIARAKLEWECTADALPQIVSLIDRERRVLRVNRAIERWGIGTVQRALGADLHALLHPDCARPDCARPDCAFGHAVNMAWRQLEQGPVDLEIEDEVLGRALHLQLHGMRAAAAGRSAPTDSHAVFVASDVTLLKNARQTLSQLNHELEARVIMRTRELIAANEALTAEIQGRQEAEHSLRASRNELRMLSAQLMTAQEDERKRLSQELHDAVGQSMSAVKYSLERVLQMVSHPDLGSPVRVLNLLVEQVQRTIDEVRTISTDLRPALLDDLGAVSAVQWFCRRWAEIYPPIRLDVALDLADEDVPAALGTAIFRTVQESLNNVARHSQAARASVALYRRDDELILEIADEGVGFVPQAEGAAQRRGFGLRGLRERADHAGGRFELVSNPGRGTIVRVTWPRHSAPLAKESRYA
ncbi:MAG: sensor histidine kinase [Gammaproteobacteria bacterium]|nr:sensor histidine kinase [Gammaproteobacteria bacterium]